MIDGHPRPKRRFDEEISSYFVALEAKAKDISGATKKRRRRTFDRLAEGHRGATGDGHAFLRQLNRLLWGGGAWRPKLFEGLRVLDDGCGSAGIASAFAELGAATVGIDPDHGTIRIGRHRALSAPAQVPRKGRRERIFMSSMGWRAIEPEHMPHGRPGDAAPRPPHLLVSDGLHLPFGPSTFDLVVCKSVLEHVPDKQVYLDEIYRVLSEPGLLYAWVPNAWYYKEHHARMGVWRCLRGREHGVERYLGVNPFGIIAPPSFTTLRRLLRRLPWDVWIFPDTLGLGSFPLSIGFDAIGRMTGINRRFGTGWFVVCIKRGTGT